VCNWFFVRLAAIILFNIRAESGRLR